MAAQVPWRRPIDVDFTGVKQFDAAGLLVETENVLGLSLADRISRVVLPGRLGARGPRAAGFYAPSRFLGLGLTRVRELLSQLQLLVHRAALSPPLDLGSLLWLGLVWLSYLDVLLAADTPGLCADPRYFGFLSFSLAECVSLYSPSLAEVIST